MQVKVIGGPLDGSNQTIPDDLHEGMMHILDRTQYFVHTSKANEKQLIYNTVSKDF